MSNMSEKESSGESMDNGDMSDYADLGLVELWDEEHRDTFKILTPKESTMDKLTYTIFSLNIFASCFLAGFIPKYYYLWHTSKAIVLITYRWYAYKKSRYHYFLFDFCYFTNFLILLYLWLPDQVMSPSIRGRLFTICYSFANGPVLTAIVLWRNSLVPHSTDKMTSLFIHASPSVALSGLRWYSTPDQGYPLCSGVSDCSDFGFLDVVFYPMIIYVVWQFLYILVVEIMNKEKIQKRDYATSYKYMVEKSKKSFLVKTFNVFGPRYRKLMFFAWQFLYTLLSINLAYLCYTYQEFAISAVFVALAFASYNGASFYIDVFSRKYNSKSN